MKRQLYAEGGLKSLLDIIASNPDKFGDILNILENVPRGDYMKTGPKMTPRYKLMPRENRLNEMTEEEVMEMLRQKQMRPEYQYDEEDPYMGPRSMRMGGGIMSIPRQQYGFGSFVSSIAKGITGAVKGVGDAVGDVLDKENLDKIAQVASFIPGPHQPFAQAYTMGRSSGIGGSDYGGFQIGGFTPSGGTFGVGSGTGGGVFGTGTGGTFGVPGSTPGIPGIPGVPSDVTNALRIGSQFVDTRQGGGGTGRQPSTTGDILGTLLNVGVSAYGAYQSKKEQEKINELKRQQYEEEKRRYDEFLARQARKRRQYAGQESLPGMTVTGRNVAKSDVVGRRGASFGGITDLNIRTNPQGVKEIDYRQKGGFVPPIGIKEKADDIPAMLSNNEFVFTADAVRGAGKGNVNEGAKKMYALMKKLEAGGKA